MKVMVTGASGFIGRPLTAALVSASHQVRAAVRNRRGHTFPAGIEVTLLPDLAGAVDWPPLVASGRLEAGDELPTIRALAEKLLVNPNTVARAYRELETAGVVIKRSTTGTYVSDAGSPLARRERLRIVTERRRTLMTASLPTPAVSSAFQSTCRFAPETSRRTRSPTSCP